MIEVGTRLKDLTGERCASIAQSLKLSLTHFGLVLNPSSPLARVIMDLEWMGSFPARQMLPGGANDADSARVARIVTRIEQAERIAITLERVRGVNGAGAVVRCLRDNIDRLSTLHERAQDHLFELEVGGRLAARGCPVFFAEPDIRLNFPSVTIGLPCKRPRSQKKIVENIGDGVDQLERAALTGVVVVSVEPIVHPPAPHGGLSVKKPAPKNWVADTPEAVDKAARRMIHEAVDPLLRDINELFAKHSALAGVLFCGIITALLSKPSAYAYRWLSFSLPSPRDTRSPTVTELLGLFVQGTDGE